MRTLILLLIFVYLSAGRPVPRDGTIECPSGWTKFVRSNGVACHLFIRRLLTWKDARSYCMEAYGATLSGFESEEEKTTIYELSRSHNLIEKQLWISGQRNPGCNVGEYTETDVNDPCYKPKLFHWVDGAARDGTIINKFWAPTNPSWYGSEKCLSILAGTSVYYQNKVNDATCDTRFPFVCQMLYYNLKVIIAAYYLRSRINMKSFILLFFIVEVSISGNPDLSGERFCAANKGKWDPRTDQKVFDECSNMKIWVDTTTDKEAKSVCTELIPFHVKDVKKGFPTFCNFKVYGECPAGWFQALGSCYRHFSGLYTLAQPGIIAHLSARMVNLFKSAAPGCTHFSSKCFLRSGILRAVLGDAAAFSSTVISQPRTQMELLKENLSFGSTSSAVNSGWSFIFNVSVPPKIFKSHLDNIPDNELFISIPRRLL
ncbi:unnamed protein product [Caenorhabditis auriculariae]|uniref:C-type lectin domain-containing protein n=1 Tax=Caenorhabditis auriculariae TaxID=2777116 RepID=A0A8S1HST5_9PELO|nr:unnamed protein product [Caenorhabditis auriculariae]